MDLRLTLAREAPPDEACGFSLLGVPCTEPARFEVEIVAPQGDGVEPAELEVDKMVCARHCRTGTREMLLRDGVFVRSVQTLLAAAGRRVPPIQDWRIRLIAPVTRVVVREF